MKDPFLITTNSSTKSAKKKLDWDETAADTESRVEDIHDMERPVLNFYWLRLFLVAVFFILGGRMFYLQVVRGGYFRAQAENNRIRSQILEPPRGLVLDRLQKPLLENVAGYNLVTVPFDLPKSGIEAQVEKLAGLLGLNSQDILAKIKNVDHRSIAPVIIYQDMTSDQAILFQTRASEFVGFSVDQSPIRHYFNAPEFSSVLGYTGLADASDVEKFQLEDNDILAQVGKQGLELQYENFLHGVAGENQVEVDAAGKLLRVLGQKRPQPGNSLVLNIDSELQDKLYAEILKDGAANVRAAAVAMNPKTGEVLALLSLPGFDNNLFAHRISASDYQKLLDDPHKPFLNRTIAGQYPPGSTVKPMVAAAGLSEGLINEQTVIVDRGVLVIPNEFDPSSAYNFYGWKRGGLGPMTVKSAIAQSSDIYFYTLGGGYPGSHIEPLGVQKLADYYRKFHLGQPLGIDLPGEKSGIVADPAWKARIFADDAVMRKWYLGDTYHISIGQGDMLATPLQVAEWTAIIANNGVGMKPQILNRVLNPDGKTVVQKQPEVLVSKFLSDEVLKIVQEGMRLTITEGSGRQLNSLSITSAGKTGTSQFDGSDPNRTHAWFTAYAPYEDPQIVITVLVEAGGEGHAVAEPVVKEALDWWSKHRYGK